MTVGSLLPVRFWKEIRGLSPAWLACLAAMAVAAGLGGRVQLLGLFAYLIGAVALGGLSLGHGSNCRTLTLLLSQPASRHRLLLEKMGVLALMLLALCGVAWLALFDPDVRWGLGARAARTSWAVALGLPLLCGLFVAPFLTMACRNALAGVVFALAIPAAVWLASNLTAAMAYGGAVATRSKLASSRSSFSWRGMVIVCAIAAVANWWMFVRLEAIESRGMELTLPAWVPGLSGRARAMPAAPPASTRRPATWLLVKKELRLQQLTFAVSALYVVGWVALLAFGPFAPASRTTLMFMLTVFHSGAIPLLAGSLASAEERKLGTLEWQLLLPMAGWKQWVLKTAVAVGVALTMTLGLPALLLSISASQEMGLGPLASALIGWAVIPVVVTSLYVSSVSSNGLRALLIAVPAVLVMVAFTIVYAARWYWWLSQGWGPRSWMYGQPGIFGVSGLLSMALLDVLAIVMYAGALGMLLRYTMTNHQSAEDGTRRLWKQIASLTAFLAIGLSLWSGAFGLYAADMPERHHVIAHTLKLDFFTVTGVAVDSGNNPVKDYMVVIFPEESQLSGRPVFPAVNSQGRFTFVGVRPGRYSFVAVAGLEKEQWGDPEWLDRVKALALPVTLAPGESKALSLTLSRF